jgi:hypothetical protein
MYLGDPEQALQAEITDCKCNTDGTEKKSPAPAQCRNGAVTEKTLGASVRQQWLPDRGSYQTIDIILPNTIHGCKKKDL